MTTTYGNNDRLTEIINQCQEPRRVLALLALIVKAQTRKKRISDFDCIHNPEVASTRDFIVYGLWATPNQFLDISSTNAVPFHLTSKVPKHFLTAFQIYEFSFL